LLTVEAEEDVPDVVMIHDGARPLMPCPKLTEDLFRAAESWGASGFYLPLASTLLEVDESSGDVKGCVKRAKYVASETPQAFTWNVIREAYSKVSCLIRVRRVSRKRKKKMVRSIWKAESRNRRRE
jgi:2-C-methyl-D-erythritol 4-phosphate cytidylyltransferase